MIDVTLLKNNDENEYSEMLQRCNESMFFHSIPYRNLLEEFLTVKSYYIIAKRFNNIIGAIPAFIKENSEYGNIMNSLPFIGSNGGFLIDSRLNFIEKREIKQELLKRYNELAVEKDCVLSTVITSPFDRDINFYEDNLNYKFKDCRIAYIKEFDRAADNAEESIKYSVEKKCRNAISRSQKNLKLEQSTDFIDLFELHKKNIESKGSYKPKLFFELVSKHFNEKEYDIFYALMDDKKVAGLLVFYFKDTVEYFTPAFDYEYRAEAPTNFLIFGSIKKSIENGFKYYNFGGTSLPSQIGLANFKKSWGSNEYPYYYYITQHRNIENILELTPEEIIEKYKWFYLLPFSELKNVDNKGADNEKESNISC